MPDNLDHLVHYCRNAIAVFIAVLLLLIIVALSGCMTKYEINKTEPDGTNITVSVQSFREFEQPDVSYTRVGTDVEFTFGAEAASTGTSPIEAALADSIRAGTLTVAPIEDKDE